MPQTKIYTKRKIASKKQNLEHKCVLHESCKTVRSSACQGRSLRRRLGDCVYFRFFPFIYSPSRSLHNNKMASPGHLPSKWDFFLPVSLFTALSDQLGYKKIQVTYLGAHLACIIKRYASAQWYYSIGTKITRLFFVLTFHIVFS